MALVIYLTSLPTPDNPISGDIELPLTKTNLNEIGAFETTRFKTRAIYNGTSKYLLEPSDVATFRAFWRTTLNNGLKYFYAPWIDFLGIKGYVARILSFDMNSQGVKPVVNLQLELTPYIQYDSVDTTIPSPWPKKENA
jgi:hypothetical protein